VASDDPAQHEASMLLMRHRFDLAPSAAIADVWARATRRTTDEDEEVPGWAGSTVG
jgi:hypothetical protein